MTFAPQKIPCLPIPNPIQTQYDRIMRNISQNISSNCQSQPLSDPQQIFTPPLPSPKRIPSSPFTLRISDEK